MVHKSWNVTPSQFMSMSLAAYLGLVWLAIKSIDSGCQEEVHVSDSLNRRPLYSASSSGYEVLARLILGH